MPRNLRLVSFLTVCALALACTACSSNNEGKIVGKWKMVSGPGLDQQAKEFEKLKAYMFMEFKADGTLVFGVESSDPDFQKMLAATGEKTTLSSKYKLRGGDSVEVTDMPKEMQSKGGMFGKSDRARVSITINGDEMSMKDDSGTGKLTRIK